MTDPGHTEPPTKLPWPLSAINVAQIRFSRGVVGKMSYVAAYFLVGVMVVAWSCPDAKYKFYIVLIGALMFLVYTIAVLYFSKLNPNAALLEGAEYVGMKRYELQIAAKNQHAITPGANVAAPIAITHDPDDGKEGSQ